MAAVAVFYQIAERARILVKAKRLNAIEVSLLGRYINSNNFLTIFI